MRLRFSVLRMAVLLACALALGIVLGACGTSDSGDVAESTSAETSNSEPSIAESTDTEPGSPDADQAEPVEAEPADEPVENDPVGDTTTAAVETIEPVVFNDDFGTTIAPIFASGCAACHNDGGPGSPHWRLDQAGDLVDTHEWIAGVVQSKQMPPWPAGELSLAFHDNRSLRADEIEAIVAWSQAGAPLDVDEATPIAAPAPVAQFEADVVIGPHEPYQGTTEVADDYRCFIYDLELDEPRWMEGFEFVPDQTEIVHHAIGYLVSAEGLPLAKRLSGLDEATGGWQCFGGSLVRAPEQLFLGWAPGQLPTQFPEGSGLLAEAGSFIVMQIHYHLESAAPPDESTIHIDWSDQDELDPIDYDEFLGPAEIPCAEGETGPLCDRDAALEHALRLYGPGGVLANGINGICRVTAADFADMTDGHASSSCRLPIRNFGQLVSVFGHMHEIGQSIRMTLNPGRANEQILLDIPDWSFDWQLSYNPVDTLLVKPGDDLLIECSWDRSRRAPDLEPAYVLWADGTNDEMCFGTITTRRTGPGIQVYGVADDPETNEDLDSDVNSPVDFNLEFSDEVAACMAEAGTPIDVVPERDQIDAIVDQLFECAGPETIRDAVSVGIGDNFSGLVSDDGAECVADGLASPEGARKLGRFTLPDATVTEREAVGEVVADCVPFSQAAAAFGFPLPEESTDCVDEVGRPFLIQATVDGVLPDPQIMLGALTPLPRVAHTHGFGGVRDSCSAAHMKFGLAFASSIGTDPQSALEITRIAEQVGFESVWGGEHVIFPSTIESAYPYSSDGKVPATPDTPIPDPLIWLAYVAAAAPTLRLGTCILILPQRNPLVLAKELATLDHLSDGRVELGIGVGWLKEEFEALGVPWERRGRRNDEYVEALRVIWSGSHVEYHGEFVDFEPLTCTPRPVQGADIPILVGGDTDVAIRRAARLADGYFPGEGDAERLRELIAALGRACEDRDRDPAEVEINAMFSAHMKDPAAGVDTMRELGVGRVMVPAFFFAGDGGLDRLRAFGETTVAPNAT